MIEFLQEHLAHFADLILVEVGKRSTCLYVQQCFSLWLLRSAEGRLTGVHRWLRNSDHAEGRAWTEAVSAFAHALSTQMVL